MQLQTSQKQKILLLGGTNFMGKTLLDFLSNSRPQTEVYCINRGKIYWNNEARRYHKYEHYFGDRKDHKDLTMLIKYLNEKIKISESNKWKAVIDFSGFKWRDIQSVLKGIGNLAQRYIYISSDSIYNNCKTKLQLPVRQDVFDIEAECLAQRQEKTKNDRYGYNKLKCQVYIKKRCPIPYYCLRLPDVIGPYDNTQRFWTTLEWIKKSREDPIPLSIQDEEKKLSFVYSLDVCRFMLTLIDEKNPNSDCINVGFKENPTFEELARLIGKKLRIEPTFKAIKKTSNNCYPSTDFGHISIEKLTQEYSFEPTTLEEAVSNTVMFFNEKGQKYEKERSEMLRMLHKKIKRNDD